ncbi:MAG: thioredoxin family protein [Syntrophaceae bacterium]|nr:thioredoxin family protein [Syntrophaceae bacterium]
MSIHIKILGSRCGSCRRLENNVHRAIREINDRATVEKVENIDEFIRYGIARIPALVINESVFSQGKVLSVNDLKKIIEQNATILK